MDMTPLPSDAAVADGDPATVSRVLKKWLDRFVLEFNRLRKDVAGLLVIDRIVEVRAADSSVTGFTSGTAKTVVQMELGPGTWDVSGVAMFAGATTVTGTNTLAGISTTPNGFDSGDYCNESTMAPIAGGSVRLPTPTRPIKVPAGQTKIVYLCERIIFTAGGPPVGGGYMRARRTYA